MFFAYSSQQLLIPTVPLYVTEMGGSTAVAGVILAAFSLTSFPMRPFVGYLSDSWSARGVLMMGPLILAITSFGFFWPNQVWLAIVNSVRGTGWAALNTAGYTVLARVAPRERRGEASGYYNMAASIPIAGAPALALWLIATQDLGFGSVFWTSFGAAAVGLLVCWAMKWVAPDLDLPTVERVPMTARTILTGFVDTRVFLAAGLLLTITVTQVATTAFLPLYAREIGVEGIGLYFILTGIVGIVSQLLAGRFMDRGRRGAWLVGGFVLMIVSMLVMFGARSLEVILASGVLYAVGSTIQNAMLLVVAMDHADPARPGAGMATYSVSYQLGSALGAPIFGLVIQVLGFGAMFLGCAASITVGLIFTLIHWPTLGRAPAPAHASP